MRFLLPSVLFLGLACGPLAGLPDVSQEAAQSLEQALDYADQSVGPAKLSALMICNSLGEDSKPCTEVRNKTADVEEKLLVARDALNKYKSAVGSLESATKAVDSAVDAIEDLSRSVSKVAR